MALNLTPSGRRTFRGELTAGLVNSVFVGASSILAVLLKKHFNASLLELAIYASVSSLAFLLSIWVNRWMERVGVRAIILYGGLIRMFFFALLGFAQTPVHLIIFFGLSQITVAALHPAMSRLWKSNYDDRERLEVTGYINAIRSVFEMLMAYLITAAVDYDVSLYRYLLPFAALTGALAQWILARIPLQGGDGEEVPERTKAERHILVEYVHVLQRNRRLAFFLFLFFFYGMGNWIHNILQVAYIEELMGLSYKEFSLVLFIIPQFITILCFPFLARWIDRFGIFSSYFVFSLVDAIHYIFMMYGSTLTMFMVAKAIKGVANSGTTLLWAVGVLYFSQSKAEIRQFAALHLTLTGIRALLGPFIGLVAAHYLGTVSIFTMAFLCNGIALVSLSLYMFNRQFPSIARIGYRTTFPPHPPAPPP